MGISTGYGRSITSGSVFAFDTADVINSYKGEPTTNVVSNTNLDDGWAKGYHYDIIIGDTYPKPKGITSQAVSFRTANTYGYWYSYGNYAPQDDNTTYSISIWARTVGNSFYIQPYTADNSEAHRFWMSSQEVIGNGEWQRLTWPNAYTTPSSNDSDSLSFHFPSIPVGQRCWLLAPQLEPKSHVTPFIEGTRSVTQGLLPLIGNSTVDLSNVSFDANAQIVFDGTDDYAEMSSFNIDQNNEFTLEAIIYPNTVSGNQSIIKKNTSNDNWPIFSMTLIGSNIEGYYSSPTYGQCLEGAYGTSGIITANKFWHVAYSKGVGGYTTMKLYINGVSVPYNNFLYGSHINGIATSTKPIHIGRNLDGASWIQPFNGQIPVTKIYNRALSEGEVNQNYNKYKTKFKLS